MNCNGLREVCFCKVGIIVQEYYPLRKFISKKLGFILRKAINSLNYRTISGKTRTTPPHQLPSAKITSPNGHSTLRDVHPKYICSIPTQADNHSFVVGESAKNEQVLTHNFLGYFAVCWADNRELNSALNEEVSVLEEQVLSVLPGRTRT